MSRREKKRTEEMRSREDAEERECEGEAMEIRRVRERLLKGEGDHEWLKKKKKRRKWKIVRGRKR